MSELKSVYVSSWGFVIVCFFIAVFGVEEVLHLAPVETFGKFFIYGGNVAMAIFVLTMALCLLAYWNGDKKYGMVFAWLSVFMLGMVPLAGNDVLILSLDPMGYGTALGHQGLVLGIALAVFTLFFALWVFLNDRKEKLMALFLILLAIIAVAEMMAGYMFEDVADGNTTTVDGLKALAGVVAIIAALLGFYIGFTDKKSGDESAYELKSFNVAALAGLTIGFAIIMLGISAAMSKTMDDYVVPVFYYVVLGIVLSLFMILAYWNGDKKTTVACLLSLLFFVFLTFLHGNLKTILSLYYYDVFPVFLPCVALGIFLFVIAIWMLAKTKLPKVYSVALMFATVSIIILGCGQFSNGDAGFAQSLQVAAGLFEIGLGLIVTYVGFAKAEVAKLPLS